ncbi:hypothetical protein KHP62_13840 [Rhodobacteraceae bacterium NNCM2]|nr:hypothetical protein [Coraliihabitans acroporae]
MTIIRNLAAAAVGLGVLGLPPMTDERTATSGSLASMFTASSAVAGDRHGGKHYKHSHKKKHYKSKHSHGHRHDRYAHRHDRREYRGPYRGKPVYYDRRPSFGVYLGAPLTIVVRP